MAIFALLAPKLRNLAMLGGYDALVATDTLPANRYGQLALETDLLADASYACAERGGVRLGEGAVWCRA